MAEIHMGGLVSGTDTQGFIDQLMAIKIKPLENLQTETDALETDIAAWADVSVDMGALTDALDVLRKWETWNQMSATSSDTTKLTATAASGAAESTYEIFITQLAQAHTVGSKRADDLSPGADSTTDLVAAGILNAGDQFAIEGQTITIGATESLSSLRTKINTAASAMPASSRVFASILDNRLVIAREQTGSAQIGMLDTVGNALQDLDIYSGGAYQNELLAAQDALFTVNGASITRSSNSGLTDVIENITLNLKSTATTPLTLTVANDRDVAKTAILDFIGKYNAAAAKLTDYGKITLTGNTAKGAAVDEMGELQSDPLVKTILSGMRKQATDPKYPYLNQINASYSYQGKTGICDSLEDIGVWTSGRENTISVTDETKLDYMLDTNFDTVAQLFRGVYDSKEGYQHGVASDFYRYSDNLTTAISGQIDQHVAAIDAKVTDIGVRMDNMEKDLDVYEQELWNQFTAMEDAIASMQKDLSYLAGQLGNS